MKLRNKQTGEIKAFDEVMREAYKWNNYNSLAKLNEEWCDYEEPKEKHYWVIDDDGMLVCRTVGDFPNEGMCKEIGNYFETREEAEQAVEKLKAYKRLKDKGFRFNGGDDACISYRLDPAKWDDELEKDFDLLFGGEE